MKPSPPGWPRISSGVWRQDPAKAIDWLCNYEAEDLEPSLVVHSASS